MPPITSTTTSMSGSATTAAASVVSSPAGMSGCRSGRRTATAASSSFAPDPGGQLVGLLDQQPDHLGTDDPGAQHADPDRASPEPPATPGVIATLPAW